MIKSEYRFDGDSCGVLNANHEQSEDIRRGVEREVEESQGAGDQGMMFGYACTETDNYMPLSLELSHQFLMVLAEVRREQKVMTYLRPDSKSQVTVEYDDNDQPIRIHTIVVSTQHDDFDADDVRMLAKIKDDVRQLLIPRVKATLPERIQVLFDDDYILHVNPTGNTDWRSVIVLPKFIGIVSSIGLTLLSIGITWEKLDMVEMFQKELKRKK